MSDLIHIAARPFGDNPPEALAVAVSGGGDSMALLDLLHRWAVGQGVALHAVTVDHGLRAGSAEEAAGVARWCAGRSIDHATLRWTDWDGTGNLQDAARRARYGLIAEWAGEKGIDTIALGHTRDDQAETILMRLGRVAGVDGLAGMPAQMHRFGLRWVRPVLEVSRAELREHLRAASIEWTEDPSNDDPRFTRIRVRKALESLAEIGITPEGLAQTGAHMRQAQKAMDHYAVWDMERHVTLVDGDPVLNWAALCTDTPDEIRRRILVAALRLLNGAEYPPRGHEIAAFEHELASGKLRTIAGCFAQLKDGTLRISREWNSVRNLFCAPDAAWDNRWHLTSSRAPVPADAQIGALGETGLNACPNWRATGRPRRVLLASPALWQGENLLSAPQAGLKNGWSATPLHNMSALTALLWH